MRSAELIGNRLFKRGIERLRPADALGEVVTVRAPYGGFSFTSNHASNMFSLAKFTAEMIPQIRLPFYMAAILVSYSRIYNGVHYPTDVLGGGLLGYLVGWFFSWICLRSLENYRRKRISS
jgi:undecaprenyl-diphosphatase